MVYGNDDLDIKPAPPQQDPPPDDASETAESPLGLYGTLGEHGAGPVEDDTWNVELHHDIVSRGPIHPLLLGGTNGDFRVTTFPPARAPNRVAQIVLPSVAPPAVLSHGSQAHPVAARLLGGTSGLYRVTTLPPTNAPSSLRAQNRIAAPMLTAQRMIMP